MALPWLVAVTAEYVVFRRFFRRDLGAGAGAPVREDRPRSPCSPC